MEFRNKPLRTLVSAAVMSIMATNAAYSGGFSLYTEGSAAAIGNFAAGSAAEAADASIGWYNPAGLVLIREQQIASGGVGVFPISKLTGTSTLTTTGLPPYRQAFDGLKTDTIGFVPSFHYALPLGDRATFGLSMTSPFGLATQWDNDSPVRYEATYSEIITVNLSPELGARVTDNFSVGAGLDLQYARVKLNRMLGAPTVLAALRQNPMLVDSLSFNKGSSYGVGFHAGVMGLFNQDHTRIGLNYQSRMKHLFHGFSQLTGNLATNNSLVPLKPAGSIASGDLFSNQITLPELVTLSGYHDVNEKFALLGSVVYTGWNVFKTLQLNNAVAPSIAASTAVSQVLVNSASEQNYKDAWRVAIGANYHVNNQWMIRVGGGYDQTPTNDIDRDTRLPDSNRYALAAGFHYKARPNIGIDFGYTHLFGVNGQINRTDALSSTSKYNVNASTKASADLVGAQVVWIIDKAIEAPMK